MQSIPSTELFTAAAEAENGRETARSARGNAVLQIRIPL
jgi:hypothetical protein